MCGGSGTTTQQVTIPPEVLARYNAVNAKAEEVAATPFQQYSTDPSAFVAQLNPTQQAGIQNVSNAQNIAQPYFQGATSQLMAGQNTATPYYGQATQELMGGLQAGMTGTQGAYQPMAAGAQQAQDLQGGAYGQYQNALQAAQPYNQAATAGIMGGLAGSQGYNAMAGQGYNQAQAGAQPYLGAATGLGLAGTQAVNATPLGGNQINQYMSPYLNSVVGSTMANLRQQQGQEQSSLLGNQISQGAFGGDRGRVAQANLARQQDLATGQTVSGLMNQGYGQALGAAQQQQQLGLGAAQANRAALQQGAGQLAALGQQGYAQGMGTAQAQQGLGQQIYGQGLGAGQALAGIGQQQYGQQAGIGQNLAALGQQQFGQGAAQTAQQAALAQQQYGMGAGASQQLAGLGQAQYGMGAATSQALAGLGTQAQQNALGAAQAQIGAGTLSQQTEQAGKQALYNQFLQQQGYPFQTTQFLANIAEGTGALSGSTTTTNQPMPVFSDERLKEAVEPIGKTFDGQKIVKFRYKNEPGTRIGLIAQDVEKHHPDAVGLAAGYKTVDYDAATKEAAKKGHYARGGLAPESEGGAVFESNAREGFARGGEDASLMTSKQLAEILKYQLAMYGGGMPGISGGETPYGQGIVDPGVAPGYDLATAGGVPALPESSAKDAANSGREIADLYQSGKKIKADWDKSHPEYRGGLIRPHAATGGPYGTSMSSVRPRKLMVAGDAPPIPKSTFKQIMDTAGSIAGIASAGADASNSMSGGSGGPDMGSGGSGTWNESTGFENFKRGGLIPGYAPGGLAPKPSNEDSKVSDSLYGNTNPAGGLPYAGSKGYIPAQSTEQNAPTSLANPGKVGKPEPIGNEIVDLGKDAAAIAAVAMLMKRGGRIKKEGGGDAEDDQQYAKDAKASVEIPEDYLGNSPKGILNTLSSSGLNAAKVAADEMRNPNAPVWARYGLAPVLAGTSAALSTIPAGLNKLLSKADEPWYPQDSQNMYPANAGKRYVLGSDNPREAALSGNAKVIPGVASGRGNVMRPAAPQGLVPAVPSGPPTPPQGLVPAVPSGPPTPSTQPDTHAAEGALLASAGLGAPNIRQDLAQTPTQAGQGADLSAPQQQGTKATGLYAQPQQGPQGTKGGKDWMARNESWLVPLLSGVGTMAASPSRYFGGALLQGLGSAGETWQQTQTRQLERQKQATGIMSSQVGLAGETPGTKRVFDIATGQLVPVPLSDLMRDARLPPQQRKYSLTPISGATPVNALLQPAGETPQATSGTQPAVSGSAVVPATITSVFERNLEQVPARVEVNPESVNKDPDNMAAHNVRAAYHDVMQNQQNNNQMALSLLGMGAVSGPTAEPITVFKKTINGMLNAVGIQGFSDLSNQVTQDDINQKSAILNAMAATGGAGQTANQSLATALAAMPTRIQTPEARAALGFTMLQASQQIKDLGRVYNDLYAAHGDNPYAMQSFTGVEQAWRPNMSPVYALEKSIGSDLLNPQSGINQRTITLPDGSVQKFGEYLIKHAGAWEGDPKISGYLNKFYAPLINQSGVKYDVRQIGRYFQGE